MSAAAMSVTAFSAQPTSVNSRQLEDLLDTWEVARSAYGRVLQAGVERSDAQLAKDNDYQQLLQAGIKLQRLGGPSVVGFASKLIGTSVANGCPKHFERLWAGLLPADAGSVPVRPQG